MATKKRPGLSPGEMEVLALLWKRERGTVQEIHASLPAKRQVAAVTVQTLLRRLEKKGYVRHETEGRAHVFYPVAAREEVVGRSVGEFLQRLFGGDPVPLMLHLAETKKITAEDLERLKKLIKE